MKKFGLVIGCFCVLVCSMFTAAEATNYQIIVLNQLPGFAKSKATGINNAGQICGYCFNTNSGYQSNACVWSPEGAVRDQGPGAAYGINNSGWTTGVESVDYRVPNACIWDPQGNRRNIPVTNPEPGGSYGSAINNSGTVAGTYNPGIDPRTFVWSAGQALRALPTLPGFPDVESSAINNLGWVAGRANDYRSHVRAFMWDKATMHDLGDLGGNITRAHVINDAGQVVGDSDDATGYPRPFRWDATHGMISLSNSIGTASGINNAGIAVGDLWNGGCPIPMLWDTNGVAYNIGKPAGWIWASALSINDYGQIVGQGDDPSGNLRALLWVPVPEPSSLLALLCGIGSLSGMIRKRKSA